MASNQIANVVHAMATFQGAAGATPDTVPVAGRNFVGVSGIIRRTDGIDPLLGCDYELILDEKVTQEQVVIHVLAALPPVDTAFATDGEWFGYVTPEGNVRVINTEEVNPSPPNPDAAWTPNADPGSAVQVIVFRFPTIV
jgi:hypothetical protein